MEKYLQNWNLVIFTTENFDLTNYNSIEKIKKYLPYKHKNNKQIFYYINDNKNNLAFCISLK
jgi:hypothetical protein